MTDEQKPVARGSFSKTPFAHILLYLLNKRMSGTLVVTRADLTVHIYFRNGTPAKVRTDVPHRELGHLLIKEQIATEAQIDSGNAKIRSEGGFLGQTLVQLGTIDIKTLVGVLKKQMLLKLTDVFAMVDAAYAFYNDLNQLTGFGPNEVFPIHPYPVIMSGLRSYFDKLDWQPLLFPLETKWMLVKGDMDKIRLFRLTPKEKQVVGALLSGPRRYGEIMGSSLWEQRTAQYVLYAMLITKLLIVKRDAAATPTEETSTSLSSVPPEPAPTDDPELNAFKDQMTQKAEQIGTQSYYEMLGLDKGATMEEIRKAFFALSKKFHPDRLPKLLRGELKETAEYLFSNLLEAHEVLVAPDSREAYDKSLGGAEERSSRAPLADQMEVRDALEAESLFQRAIVFLNQRQLDKARKLVDEARMLSPKEGEYLALSAHLEVLGRPKNVSLDDLERKLRDAAADCPKSERVNFFLADLLKRSNKLSEAKTYFKKTLTLNPHNIEAAREIRLIEMRERQRGKEKNSSFFKKIFK